MSCQRCESERVASVTAKCGDCSGVNLGGNENEGYVPNDMGIGSGDYVEFSWCLDCGQLQGTFPLATCELEKEVSDVDVSFFFENNFSEGEIIGDVIYSFRRMAGLVGEAKEDVSPKFGKFLEEFLETNRDNRFPSAEKFVSMFKENNPFLEEKMGQSDYNFIKHGNGK